VSADENTEDETSIPPLMTIWCAAHRSNLAWKSVSESVRELKHIVIELVAISSFYDLLNSIFISWNVLGFIFFEIDRKVIDRI